MPLLLFNETWGERARTSLMSSPKRSCLWLTWLASLLTWAILPAHLLAAIVQTGNVSPNVSTWTSTTAGHIGRTSRGSVTVDAGSLLFSQYGWSRFHMDE